MYDAMIDVYIHLYFLECMNTILYLVSTHVAAQDVALLIIQLFTSYCLVTVIIFRLSERI